MSTQSAPRADLVTTSAIAVFVGVVSTQLHEAGGHGGACLALGRHLMTWGAFYVDCDTHTAPLWQSQVVAAAGSTVNVIAGLIAFLIFKATPAERSLARWFWWFAFALNGMEWAGYYAFSGIGDVGDWGTQGVLSGVPNPLYWRVALAVGGALLYWLWVRWAVRELGAMTGRDEAGLKLARRMTAVAYFANGLAAIAIGVLNPMGFTANGLFILLASAAASSFGGASGLLWGPRYMRPGPPAALTWVIERNWAWIIATALLLVVVAVVLGPSLTF